MVWLIISSLNLLDESIKHFGLSQATFGFLACLYLEDGQRQDQLWREIIVNKSTVTRAVHKLEMLGYVRREPEKSDRRVVRVFLTPKSLVIRDEIMKILQRHSEIMVRGFSKKQISNLIDTLKKVYTNVRDYKNEMQKKNGKTDES